MSSRCCDGSEAIPTRLQLGAKGFSLRGLWKKPSREEHIHFVRFAKSLCLSRKLRLHTTAATHRAWLRKHQGSRVLCELE
eukprot:6203390-Pleurochrysis_carterae.AAC.4